MVRSSSVPRRAERRFLFYSHDGLGLGHVRRNLAIAAALAEGDPGAAILMATSADEVSDLGVPAQVDVLKLPGMRKVANGQYAARRLPLSSQDVTAVRRTLLEAAIESFRPTVLVADKHPLGIGGELRPALDTLRAAGGRAVLGFRDILDDPATVFAEWAEHELAAEITERYDRVLVYGAPAVFDTLREYRLPREIRRLARYCGYVLRSRESDFSADDVPRADRPVVVATAGGGEDGFRLLDTFLEVATRMPWFSIVVSGRQSSRSEREALKRRARDAGAGFWTFVPALATWFQGVDALVCMGGYNTLVEAAAAGVPTVCVPRAEPRQEQLIRARAFARLGLLRTVPPEQLDPGVLGGEVVAALASPRAPIAARARSALGLDGARTAAAELLGLAANVRAGTVHALAAR
jgi:predicted glycosyltransferase